MAATPPSNIPPRSWRLIPMIEGTGREQMALDAWIWERFQRGEHPPTLRFYRWDPPAISLGQLQKQWPEAWDSIRYQGRYLDLVRRPTGGRAVLHQGDLCYSVITSATAGQGWQVYREICDLLIVGWRRLGVELQYGSPGRGYSHNPSCFNTATAADLITTTGQKLIGSAQRRGKGAILQQGSMILSSDRALFEQIFDQPAPWEQTLYTPEEVTKQIPTILEGLTETFQTGLGVELMPQPLSDRERQEIERVPTLL